MSAERLKHIRDVTRLVHKHLTWEDDIKTVGRIEHWQSHASSILENQYYRAKDDCDGYALTAIDLLLHRGLPAQDLYLELCEIPEPLGGGYHLVASIMVGEEKWVIDNNFLAPKRMRNLSYRWDSFMRLSEKGVWRSYQCS